MCHVAVYLIYYYTHYRYALDKMIYTAAMIIIMVITAAVYRVTSDAEKLRPTVTRGNSNG